VIRAVKDENHQNAKKE